MPFHIRPNVTDANGDGVKDIILVDSNTRSFQVLYGNLDPSSSGDVIGLGSIDLSTVYDAKVSLRTLTSNLNSLSTIRGRFGAYASRLESAANSIGERKALLTEASTRITDLDIAEETARLVRSQILSQIGTALIAQANQNQQLVLQLLDRLNGQGE